VPAHHFVERIQVHRRILANRCMRTAAGLHTDDPIGRERLAANEKVHVLAREDVIGDDAELVVLAHPLAQHVDERRFTGSHRSANAETHGALVHDLNKRDSTYW
jgi:hypothetical protein